jgi:hypothetical protein
VRDVLECGPGRARSQGGPVRDVLECGPGRARSQGGPVRTGPKTSAPPPEGDRRGRGGAP